jgi:tRNA threonylcarbamoyl adenosine modification protein YeaZ
MELAIDTSSNNVGIALARKGEILASLTWQTTQNHTTELLPNLVCLLRRVRVQLDSMEAVIVARGPGSFNGLRVGMSTAKGLAFSLNIPLVGVNTFEAEAFSFAFTGLPVRPVHKAGRDEVATALYRQEGNELQRLEEENITRLEVICLRTRQRTLFCGEIPSGLVLELRQNLGNRAIISHTESRTRVNSVATLGWQRLNRGEQDNPVTLQPLYLRPPHITVPRRRTPFPHRPGKK